MRIGTWRKSQSSNGYYNKSISRDKILPVMIWASHVNLKDDLSQYTMIVYIKNGRDGEPRIIGYAKNYEDAKNKMINFMKQHPRGI